MSSARDYLAEREESREWARQTVEKYAPLVNRIARHLLARMPANVQVDDLVQSGMIGLLDAAKKYDHTKGASFETYAGIRIQGAMLDEVRKGDWTPRSVHRKSRGCGQGDPESRSPHRPQRQRPGNRRRVEDRTQRLFQYPAGLLRHPAVQF